MALATQNPVETYGTYHLPEAQMDRFIMKLSVGYPHPDEEIEILDLNGVKREELSAVITLDDIIQLKQQAAAVTGGKGGGRPDSAMAGMGDVAKADEAVASFADIVKEFIK
jgi:MoxR-like ATPase